MGYTNQTLTLLLLGVCVAIDNDDRFERQKGTEKFTYSGDLWSVSLRARLRGDRRRLFSVLNDSGDTADEAVQTLIAGLDHWAKVLGR